MPGKEIMKVTCASVTVYRVCATKHLGNVRGLILNKIRTNSPEGHEAMPHWPVGSP